jgi:CheY-like chemotaxis protein
MPGREAIHGKGAPCLRRFLPEAQRVGTMSGDLVSIRLLCVAAAEPSFDLWQQGAALASVPVEFLSASAAAAAATLRRGGVDVCLVDFSLPEAERARVIASARAAEPPPFVVVCAPRAGEPVDGADRVLARPASAQDAQRLVELCLRVKFPTRVLLVDDSGTMRSIVRKILGASGFALDIHEASEGASALDQVRDGGFGVVFLDYNMPGFNGIETLSAIKRENPSVAVVIMTSTLDNVVAERARAAGALGYLKKPFYPADVDALLERHFGAAATMS